MDGLESGGDTVHVLPLQVNVVVNILHVCAQLDCLRLLILFEEERGSPFFPVPSQLFFHVLESHSGLVVHVVVDYFLLSLGKLLEDVGDQQTFHALPQMVEVLFDLVPEGNLALEERDQGLVIVGLGLVDGDELGHWGD